MNLRRLWQKHCMAAVDAKPGLSGGSVTAAAPDAPILSPWTLTFRLPGLESAYRQHYNARAKVLDQQVGMAAAAVWGPCSLLWTAHCQHCMAASAAPSAAGSCWSCCCCLLLSEQSSQQCCLTLHTASLVLTAQREQLQGPCRVHNVHCTSPCIG